MDIHELKKAIKLLEEHSEILEDREQFAKQFAVYVSQAYTMRNGLFYMTTPGLEHVWRDISGVLDNFYYQIEQRKIEVIKP